MSDKFHLRSAGPRTVFAIGAPVLAALAWWDVPFLVAATVPTALCAVAAFVVCKLVASYPDDRQLSERVGRWAIGAFVVHFAIGVVIASSTRLTTYLGGDAMQYHAWANGIVEHWLNGTPLPVDLPVGKNGYPYLVAAMYWVFGDFQVIGVALNAFFGAALVPLMVDTTRRLYGSRAAWWAPPLVVLPIGLLLWLSQMLREAMIMFLIAVALNAACRLERKTRLISVVSIAICVALLFTVRNYMAVTLGAGLFVGLVLGRRGVGGVGAGGGAALFVAVAVLGLGIGTSGLRSVQEQADLNRLNVIRKGSATGAASGFLTESDISSGRRAAEYLPIALPRFFLGPFPWEIRPGRQLLALPDVVTWWLLLPSLWRGLLRAWRRTRRGILLMIVPAAGASMVLALLVANYGTVVRSRLQIFLLLIPLIALGLEQRHASWHRVQPEPGSSPRFDPVPSTG